jgi:TolB protein
LSAVDSILAKKPNYKPALFLKGKILCQTGQEKEACTQFVQLLEADAEVLYVPEVGRIVGLLHPITKLTRGAFDDAQPRFFPSGEKIVFQSNRNGNWDLFEMNTVGGEIKPLLTDSLDQENPVPDFSGEWLYFTQNQGKETRYRDIFRLNVKTDAKENVVSGLSDDWYPAPGPKGQWLFFVSNRLSPEKDSVTAIFRQKLASQEPPEVLLSENGPYAAPCVLADGSGFLFTRQVQEVWHLYRANSSGKKVKALGTESFNYGNPFASPDGKQVVFFSNRNKNYDIYLKNLTTGKISRLTRQSSMDLAPAFSPDGSSIVFQSNRTGHHHIYKIDLRKTVSRGELLDQLRRITRNLE